MRINGILGGYLIINVGYVAHKDVLLHQNFESIHLELYRGRYGVISKTAQF